VLTTISMVAALVALAAVVVVVVVVKILTVEFLASHHRRYARLQEQLDTVRFELRGELTKHAAVEREWRSLGHKRHRANVRIAHRREEIGLYEFDDSCRSAHFDLLTSHVVELVPGPGDELWPWGPHTRKIVPFRLRSGSHFCSIEGVSVIDLTGKVALITGASRGIGRGCAEQMARCGASVAVNYRSHPDEGEEVAEAVRSLGGKAATFGADVSDRDAVDAMVEGAVKELGRIDIVVANAYYSKREPFLELDVESVRKTLDVTLMGAFHVAQAGARQMVQQGDGGSILFISSVLSFMPYATSMPYNAAKAGMNHMAMTIANEMTEHRVRVNVIQPGWTDTPGERQFSTDEQIREGAKTMPWKRLGTIEDLGKAAAFLSSDDADYITGATLKVDGGLSLK
jgi:glucose 1-dehydrogenase